MAEEQERKKRVVVESLVWLTESSIMSKKQRSIEGVDPSSILELKAQLYKSQEESKKSKELNGHDVEVHCAKKKITSRDSFSSKNSGVEGRPLKYLPFPFWVFIELLRLAQFQASKNYHLDKLELKAVKDGSAGYAETGQPPQAGDVSVPSAAQDEASENDAPTIQFSSTSLQLPRE
ncbi:uncharacterized protein At4g18257-like [Mangifera indica]|uniref:uncharacterized protein At4g18257-like n=1 Tax=Mangifera indica TaxID=29780 RepID=UPI001CFA2A1F|nr:uncharacterized protein At4g18257-like [Mangifera indica]